MKKFLLTLLAITILLAIGCTGNVPTEPDPDEVFVNTVVGPPARFSVEGTTITWDGIEYDVLELIANEFGPTRGLAGYDPMPPDWEPDGTLMTDNELLVYFAAHLSEGILGSDEHPMFCELYELMYLWLWERNQQTFPPFTYMRFMVWLMEMNRYDVPDEQDSFPPCA